MCGGAGPEPRLVERMIIRERMLVAPVHPEEDEHTEKHELGTHDSIVSGATGRTRRCAVRDTRRKDRWVKPRERQTGRIHFQRRGIWGGANCERGSPHWPGWETGSTPKKPEILRVLRGMGSGWGRSGHSRVALMRSWG